ncbi:MAG TPA: TlpA disulfide reductase family protein [Pirellulales bacterium]|nr:TlpA disulfide reductase family protein [Pirellulales bacterium]
MPPLSHRSLLAVLLVVPFIACSFARAADEAKDEQRDDSQYDVPEGTPEELLAFIRKQQQSKPAGTNRKENNEHRRKVNEAIVTAAERISDAKADDATLVAALKAELDALTMLKRLGEEGASEKLDALTEKLKNDKRPAIASLIKLQSLSDKLAKLDPRNAKAVEEFVSEVKEFLPTSVPSAETGKLAYTAMVLLFNGGDRDGAVELGRGSIKRFLESDQPDALLTAGHLGRTVGQILEAQGEEKQAAKFYREVSERLAKSDDPMIQQAADQLEGSARKLELVGQPMPISGKLVDGGKFDLSQYKGKVVLIDFWATWCGPCIGELPNVKEVYEKYHDRGFEVVGISLDNERDALTKFIEEKHIPWPVLFEGGEDTSGWSHPLAKKYGVNAIPMAVLVDRQGKVVTLSARGERLGELVAELIDAKPGDSGKADTGDKKAG